MAYLTTTVDFSNNDQVTSGKLDEITSGMRLASESVDGTTVTLSSGVLSVGVLGSANLGASSVTTNVIADLAVTAGKLAADAVETAKIKDAAVTNAKLLDGTILFVKLGAGALATQTDMQSETASKLAAAATMKYHPGTSKAGGVVTMATGAISGGYNTSGSATGSATSRVITLSVTMANTNYRVQFSQEDTATTANAPSITAKTTTTFTINGGGTAYGFDVFGTLA